MLFDATIPVTSFLMFSLFIHLKILSFCPHKHHQNGIIYILSLSLPPANYYLRKDGGITEQNMNGEHLSILLLDNRNPQEQPLGLEV